MDARTKADEKEAKMRFTGEKGGGRKSGASPTPTFLRDADSLATIRIRFYYRWRKDAEIEASSREKVREKERERKRE